MKIKVLTVTDVNDLRKIRLQALRDCPEAFGSSYEEECAWDLSVYENRLLSDNHFYFGAFVNGCLVGIVCLSVNERLKMRHRAMITSFFVDLNYRGKGVGKQLISSAVEKARSLQTIEQIELSVVTGQLAAMAIYKSAGFEIYGKEEHSLKIGDRYYDEYYMMKKFY